jgi:dTDP-4-amino-4,6-dideoxygalactose transaminase
MAGDVFRGRRPRSQLEWLYLQVTSISWVDMSWLVPLADVEVTQADVDAVVAAYRSGWLSMGPRTQEFEAAFASFVGVRHAVAVSSGTAALHLMYAACELGPGDEVVVPSMTFVATAAPIRHLGAVPVFADIVGELEPWLSPAAAEAAMGPATKAIVHMPYGGHPGEVDALHALAARHGVLLLQDAAHAVGAKVGDRHVGAIGHAAAFSFFSNKNLAIGEGGMVVTDDDEVAERVRRLRSHGMTTLSWDRQRGRAAGYDIERLGFNFRLDDPRAALGLERLGRLDAENAARAALVSAYRTALGALVPCSMPARPGTTSAHHLFTIVLPPGTRDAARRRIAEHGVQTSVHYPPVHRFTAFRDAATSLPVTERYGEQTLTLPLFGHMTPAQQRRVVDSVVAAIAPS